PRADPQMMRIGDGRLEGEDRAHRQEGVGALGPQPLAVTMFTGTKRRRAALPVARRDVVEHDVTEDMAVGLGGAHMAGGPSDHDAQLAFEVQGMTAGRPDDRVTVGHDRVAELREDERPIGGLAAALGHVIPVVEPDAHDLAWPGHGRRRAELAERNRPTIHPDEPVRAQPAQRHSLDRGADAAELAGRPIGEQAFSRAVIDVLLPSGHRLSSGWLTPPALERSTARLKSALRTHSAPWTGPLTAGCIAAPG